MKRIRTTISVRSQWQSFNFVSYSLFSTHREVSFVIFHQFEGNYVKFLVMVWKVNPKLFADDYLASWLSWIEKKLHQNFTRCEHFFTLFSFWSFSFVVFCSQYMYTRISNKNSVKKEVSEGNNEKRRQERKLTWKLAKTRKTRLSIEGCW